MTKTKGVSIAAKVTTFYCPLVLLFISYIVLRLIKTIAINLMNELLLCTFCLGSTKHPSRFAPWWLGASTQFLRGIINLFG